MLLERFRNKVLCVPEEKGPGANGFCLAFIKTEYKTRTGDVRGSLAEDHIFVRLEPQVQDYVEGFEIPKTRSNCWRSNLSLRKGIHARQCRVRGIVIMLKDEVETSVGCLMLMIVGEIGEIHKPELTHVLYHEIDTGDKPPVISLPYRYNRIKVKRRGNADKRGPLFILPPGSWSEPSRKLIRRRKENLGYKGSRESGSGEPERNIKKGLEHRVAKRTLSSNYTNDLPKFRKKGRTEETVMPSTSGCWVVGESQVGEPFYFGGIILHTLSGLLKSYFHLQACVVFGVFLAESKIQSIIEGVKFRRSVSGRVCSTSAASPVVSFTDTGEASTGTVEAGINFLSLPSFPQARSFFSRSSTGCDARLKFPATPSLILSMFSSYSVFHTVDFLF
ncbi:uncharacterized protein TNCV_4694181 [Trichonephila clavipes]|uniref:Uncharacterized protein n=1 Tax=Trichonephila clavipes TaxID=2585209 RepID=A0A8X6WBV8_TRICX|nr:uncharacterized protein TNCV_4694181 [Trichonephila clavipes]